MNIKEGDILVSKVCIPTLMEKYEKCVVEEIGYPTNTLMTINIHGRKRMLSMFRMKNKRYPHVFDWFYTKEQIREQKLNILLDKS